ncbi:LVIVD repeat-containing protein [Pyxidicoccus xibeiensis]|uniref:LVIVD repeat-containing protein n=1 Tax=Pyxidicoccus xibeiensis TaxID=2906759 RepID=UPI0020A7A20F|nr:hypothetical protein [Pyxidicoccus xibeiensis]MCP3137291.1 hypothetical protein [Pyxidicoccus xibeiensis]
MQPARTAWTVLLACAVSALGCGESGAEPWDGSYVPLEEYGDWRDTNPLAGCRVLNGGGAPCGSPESFDLSSCKRRSLENLERAGIFRAELHHEPWASTAQARPPVSGGGFKLRTRDGHPELVNGFPAIGGVWSSRSLLITGRDGDTLHTFVGCEAVNSRVLTGCYAMCRNGQLVDAATFRAERMARFKGEAEASSGLRLRSESRVEAGPAMDVHVAGGHAYVLSERRPGQPGGLTVFDVGDVRAPVPVGHLAPPAGEDWRSATSVDGVLYVASATRGVAVVDISQPSQPTLLRTVPESPISVSSVRVDGHRLFATLEGPEPGTVIFDISTPGAPQVLQHSALRARSPDRLYSGGEGAVAYEGRLYVNHRHEGLKVADISQPQQLRLLGQYTYPFARSAASAVGTFAGRIVAFELGRGTRARLRVLDASQPSDIRKLAEYGMRQVVSPHSLSLRGTRLYMTYHHEGLRVLDVSNPTRPTLVEWFNTWRETDEGRGDGPNEGATGLHVPGDGYVYVVDTARGLLVLDEPEPR